MEPSSLVFVAIIGVWAAYLVPHWLRRREELSQSRGRDRFSSGLRVLHRRRRRSASPHRSGDPVLTSPRIVLDADGELLYIPAQRPAPAVAAVPASTRTPAAAPAPAPAPTAPAAVITPTRLARAAAAARVAARRRARVLAGLLVAAAAAWALAGAPVHLTGVAARLPVALAGTQTALLVAHLLLSRTAGLRSRETLTVLAAQHRTAQVARARAGRPVQARRTPAALPRTAPARPVPERVARRAVAVGAETWAPVPVPPPTYTLKPVARRPEPAPLPLPAARPAAAHRPAGLAPAARTTGPRSLQRTRGSLPRVASDIERILALDEQAFEHGAAVNS